MISKEDFEKLQIKLSNPAHQLLVEILKNESPTAISVGLLALCTLGYKYILNHKLVPCSHDLSYVSLLSHIYHDGRKIEGTLAQEIRFNLEYYNYHMTDDVRWVYPSRGLPCSLTCEFCKEWFNV